MEIRPERDDLSSTTTNRETVTRVVFGLEVITDSPDEAYAMAEKFVAYLLAHKERGHPELVRIKPCLGAKRATEVYQVGGRTQQ